VEGSVSVLRLASSISNLLEATVFSSSAMVLVLLFCMSISVTNSFLSLPRSGMEWYCGWSEIIYKAVWNAIVVGVRLFMQQREWYFSWREIVYQAAWNGIVVGVRLYIERYGMVLWLDGD